MEVKTGFLYGQCCRCHATQQDGIPPSRSNRQRGPAGPVNMRRSRMPAVYCWGRQSKLWVEIGADYNGSCKLQSCHKPKDNTALSIEVRAGCIWRSEQGLYEGTSNNDYFYKKTRDLRYLYVANFEIFEIRLQQKMLQLSMSHWLFKPVAYNKVKLFRLA